MANNVKHHFVPQFYLFGFKGDEGGLHTFDKVSKRTFITTVKDAAQERYFYDIPASVEASEGFDRRGVEKALARLESGFQPILQDFIAAAHEGNITTRLIAKLAPFVTIQFLRTKTHRMVTEATINQTMQSFTDRLLEVNFPGQTATVKIKPDGLPMIHAQHFLDPDVVYSFSRDLTGLAWSVGINETEHPLYTSDHPVARRTKGGKMDDPVGLAIPGLEMAFPLSKKHLLVMYDREAFPERRIREMRSFTMPAADVSDYNGLQVFRSAQRIYCPKDDFDLARSLCEQHPHICDPDRPRARVEITPIVNLRNRYSVTAIE